MISTQPREFIDASQREYARIQTARWRYWADCRKAARKGTPQPNPGDYAMLRNPGPKDGMVHMLCDECGEAIRRTKSNVAANKKHGRKNLCHDCREEYRMIRVTEYNVQRQAEKGR